MYLDHLFIHKKLWVCIWGNWGELLSFTPLTVTKFVSANCGTSIDARIAGALACTMSAQFGRLAILRGNCGSNIYWR